jgi:serine/threonine protein kinase
LNLVGKHVGSIRIVEMLGKGGMGEVYAGVDETLQRQVALKVIRAKDRLDESARARFLREAQILSQLDHCLTRARRRAFAERQQRLELPRIIGKNKPAT